MQIWPAIDLRGGKCVRLQQGDYDRETVFGDDPAAVAKNWAELGAEYIHLVDLDGARDGYPANLPAVEAILKVAGAFCELGGGIRNEATIRRTLELGVGRVVIGTLAIKEPHWFRQMGRTYRKKLALGIDARDGRVATDGWLETSDLSAIEVARQFQHDGIAAIIYTDIATDGMMAGPNLEAMAAMQAAVDVPVIASGGVTTRADVAKLAAAGLAGCIIGRALYEGTITLPEAIEASRQGT